MKQPHWVWATDANTKERIPLNLSVIPTMLRRKTDDGREITVAFMGGLAIDQNGMHHYAKVHILERDVELFTAPPIPLADPLPKAIAKLAKPHIKDK